MQLKRIDIFQHPASQYGVLDHFSKKLKEALERSGVTTRLFHPEQVNVSKILEMLEEEPPDFTLGFNIIMSKASPFSFLHIPHIAVLVDWATYYPEALNITSNILACVDNHSCDFFSAMRQKNVLFFPHAIEREIFLKDIHAHKRDLEVVFSGTYLNVDKILAPWREQLSVKAFQLMDTIAEETLNSSVKPHTAFFHDEEVLKELKNKQINILNYFTGIDQLIRARNRIQLLQAVEGADLHIFGAVEDQENWKAHLQGKKSVYFHGPCRFEEMFNLFLRAKYVLSSTPMHKMALHERLLYALALGASVITNENQFLRETFINTSAIVYVTHNNYSNMNHYLKQDEGSRIEEVMKAREIIQNNHTWDHRAELLHKIEKEV